MARVSAQGQRWARLPLLVLMVSGAVVADPDLDARTDSVADDRQPVSNPTFDGATGGGLSGEQAFMACAGCHSLGAGEPHGVGPNLHGLAGRRAGSAEGFAYSPALAAAELTWDAGTLTAWIVQTEGVVPGTWMLYHNHLAPDEVTRLVAYLLEPRPAAPVPEQP